jgi:hypothetical protein
MYTLFHYVKSYDAFAHDVQFIIIIIIITTTTILAMFILLLRGAQGRSEGSPRGSVCC